MPLVSVIMPSYNCDKYISKAIESVLSQTFADLELLIVDNMSTDNSLDIARNYKSRDSRVHIFENTVSRGAASTRNIAIEASCGRYIAFLDSDDIWYPDKLAIQISSMKEANSQFSYTAYEKIDSSDQVFSVVGVSNSTTYSDLLKTCTIGCLTAIYDTSYFGKQYMNIETGREDYALWLSLLKSGGNALGINQPLAQYRVYDGQSSAKKLSMAKENWKLYREVEGLGYLSSLYYFFNYAFRGYLRTNHPKLARRLGFLV